MALRDIPVNLGSGMNDTAHEAKLQPGDCPLLRNMLPKNVGWGTRRGMFNIQDSQANARLLTIFAFRTLSTGDYKLCGTQRKGVFRLDGTTWVAIPQQGINLFSQVDNYPWWVIVRGTIAYGCRPGMIDTIINAGRVLHITKDRITKAGVQHPATAPNCNNAAGGTAGMAAGVYTCAYTFVLDMGTADECESDLSPTDTATLGAGDQITFAAMEVSTHPRCNGRRLYISTADGAILFRVLEIGNIPGTFVANVDVAEANYGDQAITGLTFPPINPTVLTEADGRMWVTDGSTIYPSEFGKRENFDLLKSFTISRPPNTPSQIRAMHPWDASRVLVIGMDTSVHYLVRDDSTLTGYRVEDISTNIGVAGDHSITVLEGVVYFYSGKQVWASTGGPPVCISDTKVERLMVNASNSFRNNARMAANEATGEVLISFSLAGVNGIMASFSVRDGKWKLHSYFDSADGITRKSPNWMGYVPASPEGLENGDKFLAATFYEGPNLVFNMESNRYYDEDDTGSTPIRQEFVTESIQADGFGVCVRRIRLAIGQRDDDATPGKLPNLQPGDIRTATTVTLSLRLDGNRETASRTVLLNALDEWLPVNLNNLDDPARTVAVHAIISSKVHLVAYSLIMEVMVMKSRIGSAA